MIKNLLGQLAWGFSVVAMTSACNIAKSETEQQYQGVVELDERVLAFEVGGRVTTLSVKRGDPLKGGETLATLDDRLEATTKEARAAEADAAKSEVALLKAGPRSEDIRALAAEVRAIQSTEALLRKNVARTKELYARGVVAGSEVDDLETKLATTVAQRQSAEQRLKSLKRGARSQEIDSAKSRAEAADKGLVLETELVQKHVLKSSHEGVVLDVHVEAGEVVAPGAPVVTVGDTSHPYADVFVPVGQLDGITVGTPGSLHVDSTAASFPAKVEWISRRTEFTPRYLFSERERPNLVVRVRLRIDDPEQKLHAGVPAFVRFQHGK